MNSKPIYVVLGQSTKGQSNCFGLFETLKGAQDCIQYEEQQEARHKQDPQHTDIHGTWTFWYVQRIVSK